MNELSLFAAFFIGIAGSVHCIGMCGGIVSAFAFAVPKGAQQWPYVLAYNIGRILSYTLAGGLTGMMGQLFAQKVGQGLVILQFVSAIFLFMLALYIAQWWRGLSHLEKLGGKLWRHIRPWSTRFLPFPTPLQAIPYGLIWGWLPCGLVYSTLTWSRASGAALNGAAIMLFFGLGTLPAMFAMAASVQSIKRWLSHPKTKKIVALSLILFSGYIVFQAATQS
jgi:sulfite exporter TauE/SafE